MNEIQEIPEGYESNTDEFNELYVLLWLLLFRALGKLIRLPSNPTQSELLLLEQQVNKEITAIFEDHNNTAIPKAVEQITEAYNEGVKYSREALSQEDKSVEAKDDISTNTDTNDDTETKVNLSDSHKKRLDTMIKQTQDDLLKATNNTENNVKRLVRKVVSREITGAGKSGRVGKRSNMAIRIEQQLREQFIKEGIKDADVSIIDRAKRKWKLQTYSEMVARTKMNRAYIDAIRQESYENGTDLAIISTKPDTHDACLHYEGMIISLNGLSAGYLTYDQIRATKLCFHPNCGHFVRPITGTHMVPKKLMDQHNKQMDYYNKTKSTLKQQSSQDAI